MSTSAIKPELITHTIQNLQAAHNGEHNAHLRYLAFAKKADEEGYCQVAALFRAAARAECIHAENHARVIEKLGAKPNAPMEETPVRSTRENLMAAIEGETYERDIMYPEFLHIAEREKVPAAVRTFQYALEAETEHARLFADALGNLPKMTRKTAYYVCVVCGFTAEQADFSRCPVCNNPKERFEVIE